jgi:hypothetical protein
MQTAPDKSATTVAMALFFLVMHSVASAQVVPDVPNSQPSFHEDTWHVNVSPYLWLAGMNGTVALGAHEAQVNRLTNEPAHKWFREQLRSAVRTD